MKKLILLVVLLVVLLTGCGPNTGETPQASPPANSAPPAENYYCRTPGSDNGYSWPGDSYVCYDTKAYELSVTVLGDLSSNQTVSGSGSGFMAGGYGSSSMHIWTDGKGILPVKIDKITPEADWLDISLPYILKTSDLGAMGIPVGATVTFICNHDVEVLSPVFSGQTLTKDRVTDEMDNCRMKTKNFVPATQ